MVGTRTVDYQRFVASYARVNNITHNEAQADPECSDLWRHFKERYLPCDPLTVLVSLFPETDLKRASR